MLFDFLERHLSANVPIQGHVSDKSLLCDDGSIFGMFEVQGVSWETADTLVLTDRKLRLNHTYKQIAADTIIVTVYQTRGMAAETTYPAATFKSGFAASLDAEYRKRLFAQSLYENRTFIGVQVRPQRLAGELIGEQISIRQKAVTEPDADRIQRLEDVMALLTIDLKPYRPRRLGVRIEGYRVFSEIAEALVLAMTGVWRRIGLTTGRMGDALFSEHIVIDREIIKYMLPGSIHYGAMFGMKQFPAATYPGMFGKLLVAPYPCTICQSFRFVATGSARDIMGRKQARMLTAEDPAISQAKALTVARDRVGDDFAFGDYAFSLLAFANTHKGLTDVATAAWGDLSDSAMVVAREHLGLEAALFSMLPGNARLRPRPGYVSTLNFAGMAPLHAYPVGQERSKWGGPIALLRSIAGTPIRLHFHVGDVANVLVTGMTGSGKTTLMAALLAFASGRARIIALDHKRGWEMLFRAMGGDYAVLGGGQPNFAPLKVLDSTPKNIEFLTELLRGCIMLGGGEQLTPEEDRRLALGLRTVMSIPPEDRSVSEVQAFLSHDPNGAGARLAKWCHGRELGWVIDAPTDAISLTNTLHGLDTTALLDNPRARGPALLYLFHRIEMELDGRPLLIPNDEGWRALLDETFRPMIEKRLRTIRSFNGAFMFITQGAGEVIESGISRVLIEQCPTQIHLANPRATKEDYVDGLKRTPTEFDIIRKLPMATGQFLLCQGADSMVAQLPLAGMERHVALLSGSEADLRLFQRLAQADSDLNRVFEVFHEQRLLESAE